MGGLGLLEHTGHKAGVPRERNLGMLTGQGCTSIHIHIWVSLHIGGVAQGSPALSKFPVYDVITCNTLQPHALAPHPSDNCHLHTMARPPLGNEHEHAFLGLRGKVGLGRSELRPSPSPDPELVKWKPAWEEDVRQQQEGIEGLG